MSALTAAAKAWAKMPARARRDAIWFFRTEAEHSAEWAADLMADRKRYQEDAAALRAAVKLLRVAGRRKR